jgi:hypothetical protein
MLVFMQMILIPSTVIWLKDSLEIEIGWSFREKWHWFPILTQENQWWVIVCQQLVV